MSLVEHIEAFSFSNLNGHDISEGNENDMCCEVSMKLNMNGQCSLLVSRFILPFLKKSKATEMTVHA
jgi:hypothetical protein